MDERSDISAHNETIFEMPSRVDDYLAQGLWPVEEGLIDAYFPKPPARILDLGCGTGRTTVGLATRGYDVAAVDLSKEMIARARSQHPGLDFRVMDASRLDFGDEAFDSALFSFNGIDLLYPVPSRLACMREVMRVLRPGGGFVLSTHSLWGHVLNGPPFGSGTWRYAARLFADQFGNRIRSQGYFRIREGEDGLFLWTFMATPAVTVRQLRDVGFVDITTRGLSGEPRIGLFGWRTVHVYSGARRRLAAGSQAGMRAGRS